MEKEFLTRLQTERREREAAIIREWLSLPPGGSKLVKYDHLAQMFGISRWTVWQIIRKFNNFKKSDYDGITSNPK